MSEVSSERLLRRSDHYFAEWLIFAAALVHLILCPFTKVEESFNLQACHDILYHGVFNISDYDHHFFPGVVPRTCLGPLSVSAVAYPVITALQQLETNKFVSQLIVRGVLGAFVLSGLTNFRRSLRQRFGGLTSDFHLLITISQFHFMFYVSRPLPNIFALALVLHALHHWLRGNHFAFIFVSAAAVLIFRGELAIFLGVIVLIDLLVNRIGFLRTFGYCLLSLLICLGLTISVDSWFWRRILWPEGEVLYFNLILNKSGEWGVSPWPWYFYSALPRALFASLPFVILGIIQDRRTLILVLPCLIFVSAFSFLPHKELRFIIYVIPVLNVAAAEACARAWKSRNKSPLRTCFALFAIAHVMINFVFTGFMLYVSRQNYPGGNALLALHGLAEGQREVKIHIDVYSAQTGVSRFLHLNEPKWTYDKTENLTDFSGFSYLLVEEKKANSVLYRDFRTIKEINAFSRVHLDYKDFPPLSVKTKTAIRIMKHK